LYDDYGSIDEDLVKASSLWLTQVSKGTMGKAIMQSLQRSEEHLSNSMMDELHVRCMERYRKAPTAEWGGPLLFKIIMDILLLNTQDAANHLIAKYDLKKVREEDVTTVASTVGAVVKRLEQMKDPITHRPYLPDDLNEKLLKVFQTTSVEEFDETFKFIKKQAESQAKGGANPSYPPVDEISEKAKEVYQKLVAKGEWTGASTQGEAVFTANKKGDDGKKPGKKKGQGGPHRQGKGGKNKS